MNISDIKHIESVIEENEGLTRLTDKDIIEIEKRWPDCNWMITDFETMPNKDYINMWCEDAIDDMIDFPFDELKQFFDYKKAEKWMRDTEYKDYLELESGVIIWVR